VSGDHGPKPLGGNVPLNVIAVDDNCTEGRSLCYAMRSFNELVRSKGYSINPVRHAVVLFTIKSDQTESNFAQHGFELHSVLSFGPDEMDRLLGEDFNDLFKNVRTFQNSFSCRVSVGLHS
jgi:orotate phosphoribosyltransferase